MKGEGLGILGVIAILMMIITASAIGVPVATAVVRGVQMAIQNPPQTLKAPGT